jgi:uncharacterized membrane protein
MQWWMWLIIAFIVIHWVLPIILVGALAGSVAGGFIYARNKQLITH